MCYPVYMAKENGSATRSRSKGKQLELAGYAMQKRMASGRGGPRKGAGRKRGPRSLVLHRSRERFDKILPAHVTLRVLEGLPSLRGERLVAELQRSFGQVCERGDFRLAHYSIQDDHLHLLVEADSQDALSRGMNALSARVARAVNRVFERTGKVMAGRYHVRLLKSPSEVRNALRYVLLNTRKHFSQRFGKGPPVRIDVASSGGVFDGWRNSRKYLRGNPAAPEDVGVVRAVSWLLAIGWRKLGPIDPAAIPG